MTQASTGVPATSASNQPPAGVRRWLDAALADEERPTETECAVQLATFWGDSLMDVRQVERGAAGAAGASDEPRVSWKGDRAIVQAPEGARVFEWDGTAVPASARHELSARRVVVTHGARAWGLRFVRPAAQVSSVGLPDNDLRFYKYLAFAALGFHALVAAMLVTPLEGFTDGDSVFGARGLAKLLIVVPAEQRRPDFRRLEAQVRAAREEGRIGKVEAPKREAEPSRRRVEGDKRERDQQKAKAALAGLFGDDGARAAVFKAPGLGVGLNDAIGGLKGGGELGDAQGVAGLGARGTGPGGGGGYGLSLGGVGAVGAPCDAVCRAARPGFSTGRHTGAVPFSPPRIVGGLDKETILKVVRRHQNEIKFCYESELANDQKLGGKLTVAWTIDPAGEVAQADVAESGLDNANVEACVLRRIRSWRFPEPVGGGIVSVTFPWVFRAAGED